MARAAEVVAHATHHPESEPLVEEGLLVSGQEGSYLLVDAESELAEVEAYGRDVLHLLLYGLEVGLALCGDEVLHLDLQHVQPVRELDALGIILLVDLLDLILLLRRELRPHAVSAPAHASAERTRAAASRSRHRDRGHQD